MNLFEEYSAIKIAMKELAEKEEVVKKALLSELVEAGGTPVSNDYGKFVVAHRTTYEYSDKVNTLNEKIKILKHKEEEKNIAIIKSNNPYLIWKPIE